MIVIKREISFQLMHRIEDPDRTVEFYGASVDVIGDDGKTYGATVKLDDSKESDPAHRRECLDMAEKRAIAAALEAFPL